MALIRTLFLAGLVLLNGCATGYLWRESDIVDYNEQMPTNGLALFDAPGKHDVLAHYYECPNSNGMPKRRAYFVFENAKRTESAKKPRFVSLSTSNGLAQIPLSRIPAIQTAGQAP